MEPVVRYFRPGQYMFKEGESSNCMFLLRKGSVSIRKMKGSAYVEIARVYTNEIIGELSFFDRLPRSAAAVAITEVEALEIDFRSLETIWSKVPDYWKTIMKAVADRLRKADDQIRRLQKHVVVDKSSNNAAKPGTEELAEALKTSQEVDGVGAPAAAGTAGEGTSEGDDGGGEAPPT